MVCPYTTASMISCNVHSQSAVGHMSARILRSMELYLGQALFLVTAAAVKVKTAVWGIYKLHMLLILDLLIRPTNPWSVSASFVY